MKFNDTFAVQRGAIKTLPFSEPFWVATREKRLVLQHCSRTGTYQFFPRPVSIATGRSDLEWKEVDGRGEIYSYTVARVGMKQFRGHEPYAVIIARLDVGVDIVSNIVNLQDGDLRIGRRIRPYWLALNDKRHLLLFEPDLAKPCFVQDELQRA